MYRSLKSIWVAFLFLAIALSPSSALLAKGGHGGGHHGGHHGHHGGHHGHRGGHHHGHYHGYHGYHHGGWGGGWNGYSYYGLGAGAVGTGLYLDDSLPSSATYSSYPYSQYYYDTVPTPTEGQGVYINIQ